MINYHKCVNNLAPCSRLVAGIFGRSRFERYGGIQLSLQPDWTRREKNRGHPTLAAAQKFWLGTPPLSLLSHCLMLNIFLMHPHLAIDLTGQKFGFLTVLSRAGSTRRRGKKRFATWLCRCDCGQEVVVAGQRLRNGKRKACGQSGHHWRNREHHGLSVRFPSEYRTWYAMQRRCYQKNDPAYKNYGGRGLTVCDRWNSFAAFLDDMGPKPSPDLTLERVDVDGNYELDNCCWAPRVAQSRNRQRSVYVMLKGRRMLLLDAAALHGLDRKVVYGRLRLGWSLEKALTTPLGNNIRRAMIS